MLLIILQDLFEPQTGLLRYVLEQPYSREMVCNMLGLNKQVRLILHLCRCSASLFPASPVFAPALPRFLFNRFLHLTLCLTLSPLPVLTLRPLDLHQISSCLLTSTCHLTPSLIVSA